MVLLKNLSSPIPPNISNYQNFRNSSIFFTFSISNFNQGNQLSKVNNYQIVNRQVLFIPSITNIDAQYFTILNSKIILNSLFFVPSIHNQYFNNANFTILPTLQGDLYFIFKYDIDRNGQSNSHSSISFEFIQNTIIKQWEIKNLQLHGISSIENCDNVITTNIPNIFIVNNDVFNVCGSVANLSINIGTISPLGCIEASQGDTRCFTFTPNNPTIIVSGISINGGILQPYEHDTYCFENIQSDKSIVVHFGNAVQFSVTISWNDGGFVYNRTNGETFSVGQGESITFDFFKYPDAVLDHVLVNGNRINTGDRSNYSIININFDQVVEIVFFITTFIHNVVIDMQEGVFNEGNNIFNGSIQDVFIPSGVTKTENINTLGQRWVQYSNIRRADFSNLRYRVTGNLSGGISGNNLQDIVMHTNIPTSLNIISNVTTNGTPGIGGSKINSTNVLFSPKPLQPNQTFTTNIINFIRPNFGGVVRFRVVRRNSFNQVFPTVIFNHNWIKTGQAMSNNPSNTLKDLTMVFLIHRQDVNMPFLDLSNIGNISWFELRSDTSTNCQLNTNVSSQANSFNVASGSVSYNSTTKIITINSEKICNCVCHDYTLIIV